jgi:hypothetical protein
VYFMGFISYEGKEAAISLSNYRRLTTFLVALTLCCYLIL